MNDKDIVVTPLHNRLRAIENGKYRVVRNSKRRRLLDKRGENIWWEEEIGAWVWDFWKCPF